MNRLTAVVIACVVPFASSALSTGSHQQQAALKIVVIEGANAVNIIQQKTAVAPVVEVRDRNDLPVAGVPVTFSVSAGKATFAGGAQTITVTTNAAGRAAVASLNPLASGPLQINVTAALQGQTAVATITQTNVLTAAQAASAGSSAGGTGSSAGAGGGGGGLSNGVVIGIGAAAGAGALAAVALSGEDSAPATVTAPPAPPPNAPPTVSTISLSTSPALQSVAVNFSATASDSDTPNLTFRWEFGDGGSSTERAPSYAFNAPNTYTVRLTVSDGTTTVTRETTVTVRSVTGQWVGTMTCPPPSCGQLVTLGITINAVQNGSTITGTSTQRLPGRTADDTCSFSIGMLRPPRQVYFGQLQNCSLVQVNYGGCVGQLDETLNRMLPDTGGFPPGTALTCDLVRQ